MNANIGVSHHIVEPFTEDYCGNLSWGHLGNLLLQCASAHTGAHGFGYGQMIARSHVWVLSRLVVEMEAMPRTGESFALSTWVDKVYHQFTDRHFSVTRPDGTAYGHATSIWALIDTESRQPADLVHLPDGGFTSALVPDKPSPIAGLGRIRLKSPALVATHKAAFTDLDINGHVNSIRYIEYLLDHFPAEEMRRQTVRRVEMAYCTETYCGETVDIYHETDNKTPGRHLFEIRKQADGTVAARGALTF